MQIIEGTEYLAIKELFVEQFVDQSSSFYVERIKNKHCFSDGLFQTGYFGDCLKEYDRKTKNIVSKYYQANVNFMSFGRF